MSDTLDRSKFIDAIDFSRTDVSPSSVKLAGERQNYINFSQSGEEDASADFNRQMYDTDVSIEVYGNFLKWLFSTFNTTEDEFRKGAIGHLDLKEGDKVLITSMGLGEDVEVCCEFVGTSGLVHGQDLSERFVRYTSDHTKYDRSFFTVSDALNLPYKDDYFDAVYQFGGINLFGDIKTAISEMTRVCKTGGKVLFGDESLAMHLRDTDYGRMVIKNNKIWDAALPLEYLPVNANNIVLRYILGNCFYLIGFEKGEGFPDINMDVPHVGYRGGSMRTRYFGEVEGVDPSAREKIYKYAKENGTSVHQLLTQLINDNFK